MSGFTPQDRKLLNPIHQVEERRLKKVLAGEVVEDDDSNSEDSNSDSDT